MLDRVVDPAPVGPGPKQFNRKSFFLKELGRIPTDPSSSMDTIKVSVVFKTHRILIESFAHIFSVPRGSSVLFASKVKR
jgi:hypothetical protein